MNQNDFEHRLTMIETRVTEMKGERIYDSIQLDQQRANVEELYSHVGRTVKLMLCFLILWIFSVVTLYVISYRNNF
jgi:hypothetical protein